MNRPPDFDELIGGVEDPEERARLRRMHELLVEAGPPPELSAALATPPPARGHLFPWQRRRRLRPRLVLVGAAVITAFAFGYLAGGPGSSNEAAEATRAARTIALKSDGDAAGAIGVGARDSNGNWSMIVSVWGLEPLVGGDYYRVALVKRGKPIVTCGTFNVSDRQTTFRMIAAYNLKGFERWVVTLWDAQTRNEKTVLWSTSV